MPTSYPPPAKSEPAPAGRTERDSRPAGAGLGDVVARLENIESQLARQRVDDEHRELALAQLRAERDSLAAQLEDARLTHANLLRVLVTARRVVQGAETKGMQAADVKFAKVVTASEHLLSFIDEVEERRTGSRVGMFARLVRLADVVRSIRILRAVRDPKSSDVPPLRLFFARIRNHGWVGAVERLERDVTNTLLHRERMGHTIDWSATRALSTHHRRRMLQRLRDRAHELASLVRTTLRPALALITSSLPAPAPLHGDPLQRRGPGGKARVVVYTAVVQGYDELRDPAVVPEGWDFVAFSDRAIQSRVWNVRPLNYVDRDPARSARFVKLHPHVYFPEHEYSIWVDANITPVDDLSALLGALGERSFVGLFPHPHRNCVYVEAEACIARGKDAHASIAAQTTRYRNEGFPEQFGLWETGVLVRRHQDPACVRLMVAWWNEIFTGSRRDQISFPYVARQQLVTVAELGPKGTDLRLHPLFAFEQHQPVDTPGADGATIEDAPEPLGRPQATRVPVDVARFAVDIVICVHDAPRSVENCLRSVVSARRPGDRIVVVDDASGTETRSLVERFARTQSGVVLVRFEDNLGYTRAANAGMRETSAPYVVLLNSDTVVAQDTFDKLVACGEQAPRIGIVGPLSNAAGWQTVPVLRGPGKGFHVNELPKGYSVDDMARLTEAVADASLPIVPLVNGFCYAIKRRVLEDVGLFDELTFPIGYGEEDDFCLRAADAGYVCAIATDAYVFHEKSASFGAARRKGLARQGSDSLRAKHGTERVDRAVALVEHHPEIARIREAILARIEATEAD